jgi:hypothetical protein
MAEARQIKTNGKLFNGAPTADGRKMAAAAWCTGKGGSQTNKNTNGEFCYGYPTQRLRLHGAQGMAEARAVTRGGASPVGRSMSSMTHLLKNK